MRACGCCTATSPRTSCRRCLRPPRWSCCRISRPVRAESARSRRATVVRSSRRPAAGRPELVSDGSGLLVPPADADALADALDGLLGDRALLERMGNAGLRSLHERAGWPVVGALTVEAYARHLGVPEPRLAAARA